MKNRFLLILFLICGKMVFSQTAKDSIHIPAAFCDSIKISFEIPKSDTITFLMYDRWGKVVVNGIDKVVFDAGKYGFSYTTDQLNNDTYFFLFSYGSSKNNRITGHTSKLCNVTAIANSIDEKSNIKLYPNPTPGLINIDADGYKTIQVHNSIGQLVKEISTQSKTIDLSDLNQGIYMLTLLDTNNHKLGWCRFVKTNL